MVYYSLITGMGEAVICRSYLHFPSALKRSGTLVLSASLRNLLELQPQQLSGIPTFLSKIRSSPNWLPRIYEKKYLEERVSIL
jgi:hypothetical protein